jgi:hypothetical protein
VAGAEALARLQEALAKALVDGDAEALGRACAELPAELREAVDRVDRVGFQLTVLLVVRLRFQRLHHGSKRAGELFDRDPRAFAETFRRYHREVPMTAHDPWAEAAAFEAWLDEQAAR